MVYQWYGFLLPLGVWQCGLLLHNHKECSLVVLLICVILLVTTAGTEMSTHYEVQGPERPCPLPLLSTNDKPMNFISNGGWSGAVCRYPPVCGSAGTAFSHNVTERQLAVCFKSHGGRHDGIQKSGYKTNILL